ncbi:hypothetical protein BS17DRAFT_639340, partial [Gyrodon lividus]
PGYTYVPANPKDPLDAEFAAVVNAIPHGLLIERVDAPLKTIPKEGEEIRASSGGRTGGEHTMTKKVMCRVGG